MKNCELYLDREEVKIKFKKLTVLLTALGILFSVMPNIRILDINLTISDVLFILVFILQLISSKFTLYLPFKKTVVIFWVLGIYLMIIGFMLSSINTNYIINSTLVSLQYFFTFVFLPIILIRFNKKSLIIFLKTYIFGLVFVTFSGILTYFEINIFFENYIIVTGNQRLASFLGNPNILGSLLASAIPLTFYMYFKKYLNGFVITLVIPLFIAGIALTSSFGSIFILLITCVGFFILMFNIKAVSRVIFFMLPGFIAYYYLFGFPEILEKRVLSINNISDAGSLDSRLQLNSLAWEKISEITFLGYGENFLLGITNVTNVHNVFLSIWLSGGYLSIIGFLITLVVLASFSIKNWINNKKMDGAIAITQVLAVILSAFSTTHLYSRFWLIPTFLVLFLLKKDNDEKSKLK